MTIERMQLTRTTLKDQVTEILRDRILTGELAPGVRLVERDIADALGVSRVPVRDALLFLESQGLVISDPRGRSVINLSRGELENLYEVRTALEELAVELVAKDHTQDGARQLEACIASYREAIKIGDPKAISQADVELHRTIWNLTGNQHLNKIRNSLAGPIFMFAALHAKHFDWEPALALHEDLVACILRGDVEAAKASMQHHLEDFLQRAEQILG